MWFSHIMHRWFLTRIRQAEAIRPNVIMHLEGVEGLLKSLQGLNGVGELSVGHGLCVSTEQ